MTPSPTSNSEQFRFTEVGRQEVPSLGWFNPKQFLEKPPFNLKYLSPGLRRLGEMGAPEDLSRPATLHLNLLIGSCLESDIDRAFGGPPKTRSKLGHIFYSLSQQPNGEPGPLHTHPFSTFWFLTGLAKEDLYLWARYEGGYSLYVREAEDSPWPKGNCFGFYEEH